MKHYASTVSGQGLILALGVVSGIMSARILGPSGRGEFAVVTLWPISIANVICLGLNQAISFNIGRRTFTVSEVATATFVIAMVQSAVCICIYPILAHFAFHNYSREVHTLGILFVLFMPAYFLGGYSSNFFQGVQDLTRFNLIRIVTPLVFAAGLVAIYLTRKASLSLAVFSQLAGYIATLVIGLFLVFRSLTPRFKWNPRAISGLVDYGYRTQATNLANFFNQRIDQLLLSLMVPTQQLGYYAVAVTLSTSVTVFSQAAGIVTFSKGASQHSDDARITIGRSFRASLVCLVLGCVLIYVAAPLLIGVVFGSAFGGSISACRILLPGSVMLGLNQVLYNGASALGKPGLPSVAEGFGMLVTALGLYILVPRYGYIGAAIVSSAAYTSSFIAMLLLGRRSLGLNVRTLLFGQGA